MKLNPSASMKILDRTKEARPLLITKDTLMSDTVLVDNNPSRPAVILRNAKLVLGGAYRAPTNKHIVPTDPGLGETFDGTFLPRIDIDFSYHDFARSFVVGMGSFGLVCPKMTAPTCVLALSDCDGTYGDYSRIDVKQMDGFLFGVFATGQKNLTVNIGKAEALLYGEDPNEPPAHTFYANECKLRGEFLRVIGCNVTIGKSVAIVKTKGVRRDHVTAKFKGTYGVFYQCYDDNNPCGALDEYGASGIAKVNWRHDGSDAQNSIFTCFRLGIGEDYRFGPVNGKFVIAGEFDARLAQDQVAAAFRWETKYAAASEALVLGGGDPSVYGVGDTLGLVHKK